MVSISLEGSGDNLAVTKSKSTFENTAGGRRDTTSVGSSISGLGGDILIADDPNNPKDVESEAKMHSTNLWWRDVWQSRLDDAKAGAMIVVQQRVSEKDITDLIVRHDKTKLWTQVILPACFEPSRRCVVKAAGKTWKDPRTKDGELLFPARFPQSVVDEQKATMSEYAFAGQYQQRPAPQEGGLFKHQDFMVWSSPMPRFKMIVTSVDTALTTHESSSFSAATSWGVFQYDGESHLMLLSLMKARLPFEELMEQIRRMAIDCTDSHPEYPKRPHTIKPEYKTSLFIVERATQGQPLISFLEKMRPRVRVEGFVPRTYGSKLARAKTIRYFLGPRGIIWLPQHVLSRRTHETITRSTITARSSWKTCSCIRTVPVKMLSTPSRNLSSSCKSSASSRVATTSRCRSIEQGDRRGCEAKSRDLTR
ncbi:hypothetical protein [Candidatus Bealeia paramacronuclearis]|uniref:hypothetical protein n=1 Tax=Candidatus Bealeia paramacronuclearis TaxID=1921001 RepID=UPI002F265A14